MIVDSPLIGQLALGSDRNIPQEGDSQLIVPATVVPVTELMLAHHVNSTSTTFGRSSFISEFSISRNNQAANTSTCFTLPKGLWTVHYRANVRFDFAAPVSVKSGFELQWSFEGFAITVDMAQAIIGSFNLAGTFKMLVQTDAVFQAVSMITGVAENIDAVCGFNVLRHI